MKLETISLLAILAIACKGPAGDAGPKGADGATGANGANGADGSNGANGANGANGEDGATGPTGPGGLDGADGSNGVDGMDAHFGDGPWGIHLTFEELQGATGPAGQVEPGDLLSVVFRVEDDAGIPYDLAQLSGVTFMMSGPTTHEQILLSNTTLAGIKDTSFYNAADGTWTYDLPVAIPSVFAPPPNDTADIGVVDGDWGGLPLVDGTYTIGGYAYLAWPLADGSSWDESSNTTMDFLVGAATTIEKHEVVLAENCAACHGPTLYAHGGSRTDVEVCVTCHVRGGEDRYSATDPSTTPGATISFDAMIHGIHRGSSRVTPLVLNGYPADPSGVGYPDYNQHDWGYVTFPQWPDGVKDCATCHAGAAQGDVENRPSAQACEGCHDDINVRIAGGGHPLGLVWVDDTQCSTCHPSALAANPAHDDPRDNPALNLGLSTAITGVSGATGPNGEVEVGDVLTITFTANHDDGTPFDMATLTGSDVVFAGPSDHWQQVLYDSSKVSATTAVYDAGTGTFSYTFSAVAGVPATFPAQLNNTADLGIDQGDWFGEPLVDGTYRVSLSLKYAVSETVIDASGTPVTTLYSVPVSTTTDLLFGGASVLDDGMAVSDDNCNVCHSSVQFHGDRRKGVDTCVTCHTAGAEDRYSTTDPSTTPGQTIDFKVMVHKIHGGSELANSYDLNGFGTPYVTHNYNEIEFPRNDGGVTACLACHEGSDLWKDPSGYVCTSCHDSSDAAAHAAIMTDPTFGESCGVCHGTGAAYAVDAVHAWGVVP